MLISTVTFASAPAASLALAAALAFGFAIALAPTPTLAFALARALALTPAVGPVPPHANKVLQGRNDFGTIDPTQNMFIVRECLRNGGRD